MSSTHDAYAVVYSCYPLSNMTQQLSPYAPFFVAGDGNGRPIKKKNLLMGQFRQSYAEYVFDDIARAYKDSRDSIRRLIPYKRCKCKRSYSSGTFSVISAILTNFVCFARPIISKNRVGHGIYKQVSDHGRCSACPRANLSYAIAKFQLPPLMFKKWVLEV